MDRHGPCPSDRRPAPTKGGMRIALLCLLALAASAADRADNRRLGTNLSGDLGRELPFLNLASGNTEGWRGGTPGNDWKYEEDLGAQGFAFTAEGWPTAIPSGGTLRLRVPPKGPSGSRYVLAWSGTGTVGIDGGSTVSTGTRRIVFTTTNSYPGGDWDGGNLWVRITATTANDPVRGLRVCLASDEAALLAAEAEGRTALDTAFVARCQQYNTLRFMDWLETNNATITSWSQRATPSSATWRHRGVPWEVIADVANATTCHPWVCIPHRASDDYIRQAARVLRDRLDPTLRVYLEYSNEVWNSQFSQFAWADTTYATTLQATYGNPGQTERVIRYHAWRSAEVWRLWSEEFTGATGTASPRLVRVLGAWAGVSWFTEQLLAFLGNSPTGSTKGLGRIAECDAVAIAPYFACNALRDTATPPASTVQTWTLDQLFAYLRDTEIPTNVTAYIRDNKAKVNAANSTWGRAIRLICYEGGQHCLGPTGGTTTVRSAPGAGASQGDIITWLMYRANGDSRMGELYTTYLDLWRSDGGGDLFCHFSSMGIWSKWGSWGLAESISHQPPKRTALETWNSTNTLTNALGVTGALPTAATAGSAVALTQTVSGATSEQFGMAVLGRWRASGPGTAVFADASAASTTVTFSAAGTWTLTYTADDGFRRVTRTTTIAVTSGSNTVPTISTAAQAAPSTLVLP